MRLIKSHKFIFLWLVAGIPLISILVLRKTFNLALYGDDWMQLYNLWITFDVRRDMSFFDIKSYLGAYWPQYFFLGIIRHFFEYQPQAYFAASFLLRVLSTISLFFLVNTLTRNRLASFLASLIFIFSLAGLETTDWVFNMNTYAGIFLFNLAFISYLKIRQLKTFFSLHYFVYILLFMLSVAIAPVRLHSALLFILLTELFLYIFIEKKSIFRIDKLLIARILISVAIIFILAKLGSFGTQGDNLPILKSNLVYLQDTIQRGRYDILFYFFGIIGNIAIPDTFNTSIFHGHLSQMGLFYILIGILTSFAIRGNRLTYILVIFSNILWIIIGKLLLLWNPILSFKDLFSISAGYQFLFLSIIIFRQAQKKLPHLAISIIISIFWITSFSLIYFFRTKFMILESTSRYMIMGATGFSISFASILSIIISNSISSGNNLKMAIIIKKINILIAILFLTSWIILNLKSSQEYLSNLETNRNIPSSNQAWNSLLKYLPQIDTEHVNIFYFTYDNPTKSNMIFFFGFSPHTGLVYKITNWEKTPIATVNYNELLDMVKTGEPLQKIHGRKGDPVPLSRVYAFDFRGGELINITENVRKKIATDLNLTQ